MQSEFSSAEPGSILTEWLGEVGNVRFREHVASTGLSGALVWYILATGQPLCLKRWPREHPSQKELATRHDLLRHVFGKGLNAIPLPQVTRQGQTFLADGDHLWELTPWLPGEPYDRGQPSLVRRRAALHCLAEFHLAASSFGEAKTAPAPGLLKRRSILRGLDDGGLQELRQAIATKPASEWHRLAKEMLAEMERSLATVLRRIEQIADVPLPLQWCLRDVKHDHLLFEGDQVSGLIDFGAAAVDSVAGDVARLVGSMVGDDSALWPPMIEAYRARRPLSVEEQRAIVGFDEGGTLAASANWLHWLFVELRTFPRSEAVRSQLLWLRRRLRALP